MTDKTENQPPLEEDIVTAEEAVLEDQERLANLTQEELITEFLQVEQTAKGNWDKAVRAQAEAENIRRRAQRDVESAHKYGSEKLIKDLLPVVDSLERGLEVEASGDATKAMHEGMEMTLKILMETLEKNGVKVVNPEGEPFDPAQMEAVSMLPNPELEPNSVMEVIQKGYLLNERLIRPAMVVVSQ